MVFGTLEELLSPEARANKYAPLAANLRRLVTVLDKYRRAQKGCMPIDHTALCACQHSHLHVVLKSLPCNVCRELDRSSGFKSMHKTRQAERFVSRKTVDGVARGLRELQRSVGRGSSDTLHLASR